MFCAYLAALSEGAEPGIIEINVVKGHDGLDAVPLVRVRGDAEAAVGGGGGDIFVDEAEAVCGGESGDVEGAVGGGESGGDARDEVRVAGGYLL